MSTRAPMSRQQDSAVSPAPARPARPTPPRPAAHRNPLAPLTDPAVEHQRSRALERANQIRFARAALRKRIHDGEVTVAAVIADPPEEALSWSVGEALRAQRWWGSTGRTRGVRARALLTGLHIRETKPIGELTSHQRERIAQALEGHDKQAGAR